MSLATPQSILERFRRVARNHGIPDPQRHLDATGEIEWLRACLNGRVYRAAENWMLPNWALRDSRRSSKVPSECDSLDNDQRRNWTTIGGVGSRGYAISDSKGLLTVNPECGSIEFWLLAPTGIIFPSTIADEGPRLTLLSPEDQVYEWRIDLGPLEYSRLVYHSSEGGTEAIYNEVQVRNRSLERAKFTFYAVIRPISVNGVEPIEAAEFSAPKRAVYTNGILAMMMNRDPKFVYVATANNKNLPSTIADLAPRLDSAINAPDGLATVVLRFDIILKPAGTERFFFVSPLVPLTKKDPLPALPMDQRARDSTVQTWFEFMGSTLSGEFPDRDLSQLLSQSKALLAMQVRSSVLPQQMRIPDSSWNDKAHLLSALCRGNCLSLAREVSLDLVRGIQADTLTDVSAAAPAVWTILHVFEHLQDMSYLRTVRPVLDELLPAISEKARSYLSSAPIEVPKEEQQVVQQKEGVSEWTGQQPNEEESTPRVPVAHANEISASYLGPRLPSEDRTPQFRRLTDFAVASWVVEALRSAANAYDRLGQTEDAKSLAALVAECTAAVQKSSKDFTEMASRRDTKNVLPDDEVLDGIILLGTLALLRSKSIDTGMLECVQQEIAQKWTTILRMVKLPGVTREHSVHLTLLMAHYYAFNRDRAMTAALLRAVLKLLSEYYVLPDWVDPKTGGGIRGSGCSVTAAADLLLLLRDMIVLEDGEDLTVLPAIPQDWYTSNNVLVLRNTLTLKGAVQIELGASTNQRQVEIRMQSLPREIDAYLPTTRTVSMAKIYGGGLAGRFASSSSPHIRVVPLSEDVVLTFHR